MKRICVPFILAVAGLAITSCVVTDDPGGFRRGPSSASFGVYETLPYSYVGDAYYHENRYYYGGRHERGDFRYQGLPYKERYVHGDRQYYGGRIEHHGSDRQQHSRQRQESHGQNSHGGRQNNQRHR